MTQRLTKTLTAQHTQTQREQTISTPLLRCHTNNILVCFLPGPSEEKPAEVFRIPQNKPRMAAFTSALPNDNITGATTDLTSKNQHFVISELLRDERNTNINTDTTFGMHTPRTFFFSIDHSPKRCPRPCACVLRPTYNSPSSIIIPFLLRPPNLHSRTDKQHMYRFSDEPNRLPAPRRVAIPQIQSGRNKTPPYMLNHIQHERRPSTSTSTKGTRILMDPTYETEKRARWVIYDRYVKHPLLRHHCEI